MTKFQLMTLLFQKSGTSHIFRGSDGKQYMGWLVGISKEDGGEHSYNLLVNGCNGKQYSFHIRTID